jgi:Vitamin K-dependent gamma-carboxylase
MTESDRPMRSRVGAMVDGWCAFWFTPQPAYTLGLVRMTFGVVAMAWTLALLPDLYRVFGEQGVAPQYHLLDYQWSVFDAWPGDTALLIGWALLMLSAIAMTVGWHSRFAAIVVFVLIHSFHRRGVYIFNAGDSIIIIVALILALSSCGAALSLDQRRRTGSFWSAQTRAPWAIRLMQIQLSVIYLVSVQAKLSGGKSWADGSATSYAWRTDGRWALLPAPEWLAANAILVNAATWGTLVIELAIAVLVWNRRWRIWVLAAGVVMHVMMMVSMNVGFFSLAMFVLYLAFVPWQAMQSLPGKLKTLWGNRRRSSASPRQQPVEEAAAP